LAYFSAGVTISYIAGLGLPGNKKMAPRDQTL